MWFTVYIGQMEIETCLEHCIFKDCCDEDVFYLCNEIMAEHSLAMSDDVYEITDLYLRLCQMIINELGE